VLFFAAFYYLRGKENEYKSAVKWVPMLTPFFLVIGLAALFIDINHKPYFWRLYTTIKLQSPMSWGAWTLMVVTPLSFIWAASYLRELFPGLNNQVPLVSCGRAPRSGQSKAFGMDYGSFFSDFRYLHRHFALSF
jgi:formate-dependent nitrite reductase membrane component NrfD